MTRFKTLLTAFQDVSVKKSAIKAIVAITLVGGSFGIADNVGAQGPEDEATPVNTLSVNTEIFLGDHDLSGEAYGMVHNRTSGFEDTEQLSPTEFFGNAYRLSGNTYTPRLHRGEVHEKLFEHIGADNDSTRGWLQMSNGDFLVDKLRDTYEMRGYEIDEYNTCVEYHFSATISKENASFTDRTKSGLQTTRVWCPKVELSFQDGQLSYEHSSIWDYNDHESAMRHAMHQASDFVHENAWKSAFSLAGEEDEVAEFLGHTNVLDENFNVDIFVNILVELVDRDSVVLPLIAPSAN